MSPFGAARLAVTLALCGPTELAWSQSSRAGPPIRRIAPSVVASEHFTAIDDIRALSNGGILVNDVRRRRLVLLDSTLGGATAIADSSGGDAHRAYGRKGASILPVGRDSTLFIDRETLATVLIDGNGVAHSVHALPRTSDASFISTTALGFPRRDAAGRLIYRAVYPPSLPTPNADGGIDFPSPPDSAPLLRLAANAAPDTVAVLRIPALKISTSTNDSGRLVVTMQIDPLPRSDDWAVLSDGTIAIVRGNDYRVEWIRPDGRRIESRIPFEWRRITDDEKVEIVGAAQRSLLSGSSGRRVSSHYVVPPASELPDYAPPFVAPSARGDEDGNLWVRTTAASPLGAGYVYDVIHPEYGRVDRVQLPPGYVIVGFGPNATVYLAKREADVTTLERSRR